MKFPRRIFRVVMTLATLFVGAFSASCGRSPAPAGPAPAAEPLRMLLVGDPFALAIERIREPLETAFGQPVHLEIVGYNDNRRLTLLNARDRVSRYDVVSFDIVWLGEYVEKGILLPLDGRLQVTEPEFLPGSLNTCRRQGKLYGLPIQPHTELLWARKSWFEEAGLPFPRTTDEVLAAARRFHNPGQNRYGIAWNAQRGQPLGQTVSHILASFGQPLLDEAGLPAFNTEKGLRAAEYLRSLVEVSPPDIFSMAWDQRVGRFASGTVAMTYGWAARAFLAEEDPASNVRGDVLYGPPPHAADAQPTAPLGIWSLGIPAHTSDPARAARFLALLYSHEWQRKLALAGNGAPPYKSLLEDPELRKKYPVFHTLSAPEFQATLSASTRPAIPQWDALCEILGSEFHDMLLGQIEPAEALARSEAKARALFLTNTEGARDGSR